MGAQEFILQDNSGKVKCVFYPIDRPLSCLARGGWHKCVGRYNPATQTLNCVCVFRATEDEKKIAKVAIGASNAAMSKAVALLSES